MSHPVLQGVTEGSTQGAYMQFLCPGCHRIHMLGIRGKKTTPGPAWGWNGDTVLPVFDPSINAVYQYRSIEKRNQARAFFDQNGRWPTLEEIPYDREDICHSFVGRNGAPPGWIIFLQDCTHALKGQCVPLAPWSEDAYDRQQFPA